MGNIRVSVHKSVTTALMTTCHGLNFNIRAVESLSDEN